MLEQCTSLSDQAGRIVFKPYIVEDVRVRAWLRLYDVVDPMIRELTADRAYLLSVTVMKILGIVRFARRNSRTDLMGYPIYETFTPGRGVHLGKSAFHGAFLVAGSLSLVRFNWNLASRLRSGASRQIRGGKLAKLAAAAEPELVVVTGGEPVIHDLESLTAELGKLGLSRHLETSGCRKIWANGIGSLSQAPSRAGPKAPWKTLTSLS